MNWKDDQIEKLILLYSHNSLFLVPETGTRFWYQFSGTNFCSVGHGHCTVSDHIGPCPFTVTMSANERS